MDGFRLLPIIVAIHHLHVAQDDTWQTLHSPDGHTPGLLKERNGNGTTASLVYESIKTWQMYHFHDTAHLVPMKLFQDANDTAHLQSDGSHIASFLLSLRGNPAAEPAYQEMQNAVRIAALFFDDFILEPTPAEKVHLMWRQKGPDAKQALSDRTRRLICLATALLQPKGSAAIISGVNRAVAFRFPSHPWHGRRPPGNRSRCSRLR